MLAARVVSLCAVVALAGCRPRTHHASVERSPTKLQEPALAPGSDERLAPLSKAPWLDRLDLPGGDAAFVSVPLGATTPRPIMVAAHGAGDRPEWACGSWRGVTDAFPFIVCPRGTPTGDGRYYWRSTRDLERVIDRATDALRERYGAYVASGPMLYAGFSAGAIYGAAFARERASDFPVLLMSEGGYDELGDPSFAQRFKERGGHRVLLGCSTGGGCLASFDRARSLLARAGVEVRVNDAGHIGHNLTDDVVRSLRNDLPWLVSGAPGWALPAAPSRATTPDPEPSQVRVESFDVPHDLPAFVMRGVTSATTRVVFLSGACTHPGGYLQSFQFAAHARAQVIALQGDVPCGGSYRSWTLDLAKQNGRIEAAWVAAGGALADGLRDVVLIGYSQGALLAEQLAARYPERYSRVILIGSPAEPSVARLKRVRAAVMMAGDMDATAPMQRAADALDAAGVPATYLEMPHTRHGQMGDAERLMGEALDRVLSPDP